MDYELFWHVEIEHEYLEFLDDDVRSPVGTPVTADINQNVQVTQNHLTWSKTQLSLVRHHLLPLVLNVRHKLFGSQSINDSKTLRVILEMSPCAVKS